jgi:hypothetical protein
MYRNALLSWLLSGALLFTLAAAPAAEARSKASKEAEWTAKVKAGIAKLGSGSEARVRLKLRDGRNLSGYVKEIGEESFVVMDAASGGTVTVPYPDVAQVKGHHLSKGAKIAIISLSIGVAVLAFFLWLENAN